LFLQTGRQTLFYVYRSNKLNLPKQQIEFTEKQKNGEYKAVRRYTKYRQKKQKKH